MVEERREAGCDSSDSSTEDKSADNVGAEVSDLCLAWNGSSPRGKNAAAALGSDESDADADFDEDGGGVEADLDSGSSAGSSKRLEAAFFCAFRLEVVAAVISSENSESEVEALGFLGFDAVAGTSSEKSKSGAADFSFFD